MTDNFLYAIDKTLKHEGGYINDPKDSGGETNFGISKKSYPKLDIKNLTLNQAKDIYHRDFWKPIYDNIKGYGVAAKIFDMAVNMGPIRAHKLTQQACNECGHRLKVDGIFGAGTLNAVNSIEINRMIRELKTECVIFYNNLANEYPKNQRFLKGWINRALSD